MTRPGKGGRPRKEAPASIPTAQHVEKLAAAGLKITGIAKALGTSKDSLHRWMEQDAELREAFERGRASLELELFNVLYRAAMSAKELTADRLRAAMFLGKTMCGWREGEVVEGGNRVSINFTLPGALTPEDFKSKVIQSEPRADAKPVPRKSLTRT